MRSLGLDSQARSWYVPGVVISPHVPADAFPDGFCSASTTSQVSGVSGLSGVFSGQPDR